MPSPDNLQLSSRRSWILYNALPSVVWSLLSFFPISVFCYQSVDRKWLYGFLCFSLLACLIPAAQLRRLQSSSAPSFYRRVGVRWANHLAQHGTFINRLIRRTDSRYRRIRSRSDAIHLINTTYINEKFHWATLLFFLLVAIYAAVKHHPGWAGLISVLNVLYNLYPIWLQQYLRIRLERYLSRPVSVHPRSRSTVS